MALPALRQPKFTTASPETQRKLILPDVDFVILTMRNETKLVITSDAYNGIVTEGNTYKCVFCGASMELETNLKEIHKNSLKHKARMVEIPYDDSMAENLIRKLSKNNSYCTICKVQVATHCISRHTATEVHIQELEKAGLRAQAYKPT